MWWLMALLIFEPLSQSKLGIHLIGHYTEGAKKIIAAGPRVIKVLDPQANNQMVETMRDYKRRYPKGIVVMSERHRGHEGLGANATSSL